MNKTAIMALLLAILLPFTGYFLVKYYSKDVVHMPGHYFIPDSVVTKTVNGKITTDTIWHKVKNVSFINQYGKHVTLDELKGKIVIVNTFFTTCGGICPKLTKAMKGLQNSFANVDSSGNAKTKNANKFIHSDSLIQFLSISVNPEYDSAHHLRRYGDRFNANYDNWWFVTGDKKELYDFMLQELKASVADTTVTPEFVHTDLIYVLDKDHVVRSFYHALDENEKIDTVALTKIAADIPTLLLEKDKTKPSVLRGYIPILPLIFGGIACVIFVMSILNKKRK